MDDEFDGCECGDGKQARQRIQIHTYTHRQMNERVLQHPPPSPFNENGGPHLAQKRGLWCKTSLLLVLDVQVGCCDKLPAQIQHRWLKPQHIPSKQDEIEHGKQHRKYTTQTQTQTQIQTRTHRNTDTHTHTQIHTHRVDAVAEGFVDAGLSVGKGLAELLVSIVQSHKRKRISTVQLRGNVEEKLVEHLLIRHGGLHRVGAARPHKQKR